MKTTLSNGTAFEGTVLEWIEMEQYLGLKDQKITLENPKESRVEEYFRLRDGREDVHIYNDDSSLVKDILRSMKFLSDVGYSQNQIVAGIYRYSSPQSVSAIRTSTKISLDDLIRDRVGRVRNQTILKERACEILKTYILGAETRMGEYLSLFA